jgi:hypothetical protein
MGEELNNSREDRFGEVIEPGWGRVLQTEPGGGTADGQPSSLSPPDFCKQSDLALLSQPCLPPPRKQAACARVNTIQVINCLQQLAPAPGPADAQALKERANYSFISIHTAT